MKHREDASQASACDLHAVVAEGIGDLHADDAEEGLEVHLTVGLLQVLRPLGHMESPEYQTCHGEKRVGVRESYNRGARYRGTQPRACRLSPRRPWPRRRWNPRNRRGSLQYESVHIPAPGSHPVERGPGAPSDRPHRCTSPPEVEAPRGEKVSILEAQ